MWHPWPEICIVGGLIGLGLTSVLQRKRAADRLRETEGLIRSVSDNVPKAMLYQIVREKDGRRRFTYVSDGVRKMHGCSPEEAIADPNRIYGQVVEEDRQRVREEEERANRSLSGFRTEVRVENPPGNIRWSAFASSPRAHGDGATVWDGVEIDITARKHAEEQLNALSLRLLAAQDEVGQRLALDLHDQFGQMLAVARLQAQKLGTELKTDRHPGHQVAGCLVADIDRAIEAMRSIQRGLYPAILDDLGLDAAVEALVNEVQERTGIACDLDTTDDFLGLSRDRQRALYRIVQEGLTNAVRHSEASQVDISLQRNGSVLRLRIHDDGRGIEPAALAASDSHGLAGMRKRAESCGGRLNIRTSPKEGTTLTLEVPLADSEAGKY
jgi:PAS domain S-box-containing protein